MTLPTGKLPPDLLRSLIAGMSTDESVIVGPGVGRDAAAIRIGDEVIVVKTDPITFATDDIGWYVVNINANDIACMGAEPRWLLVTALLPESRTTPELVDSIFSDVESAARKIGCTLVGGHTEITEGLDRPILVGNMIGIAPTEGVLDPRNARPDDAVLLIGGIAVEGTALLATEFADQLPQDLEPDVIKRARGFLHEPGISVVDYARRLRAAVGSGLRALHDPTEGGLATGLHEIAESTGLGIDVDGSAIHVHPETKALCESFGVDPLGLLSSGALLAVVAPDCVDAATAAFGDRRCDVSCIGKLTSSPDDRVMRAGGETGRIPEFAVDEIARLFSEREDPERAGMD